MGRTNDIDIDMIVKTQLLRDILNSLLASFPKTDSCHDRRTLGVYTVEDPRFVPERGQELRGPLIAKRIPRKNAKLPILYVK